MRLAGFIVVFALGAVAANAVGLIAADPDFLSMLASVSPWAAEHGVVLGYVASGVVALAIIAIPPLMLKRDAMDGGDRLGAIGGFAIETAVVYALLFIALSGVAYLLGAGWFAARKAFFD